MRSGINPKGLLLQASSTWCGSSVTHTRDGYILFTGCLRATKISLDAIRTITFSKAQPPPPLRMNLFQGALPFTNKRELYLGLPPVSPELVTLPQWMPHGDHFCQSRFRDLKLTLFWSAESNRGHCPPLHNSTHLSLRIEWAMFNYYSHGNLLQLSLQSPCLTVCYYYQDLHLWWFHPGLRFLGPPWSSS